MNSKLQTRQTLIQRAKSKNDDEAWQEFASYYRGFIYSLLNHMKISENDIDDLAQKILLKLWKNLASYENKNTKFRSWLATIIRNTALTFLQTKKNTDKILSTGLDSLDYKIITGQTEIDLLIEEEWKRHLTKLAMTKIEKAYRGHAIDVFKLTLDGKSSDEIAHRLDISIDSVYTLRNRVKNSFVHELRRLMNELEG